jgi:hypothetical protein
MQAESRRGGGPALEALSGMKADSRRGGGPVAEALSAGMKAE